MFTMPWTSVLKICAKSLLIECNKFVSSAGNVTLPEFQWNGDHYLYTTKCNYVDLNADENGLWAIYSTPKTFNTYVVKVCMLCNAYFVTNRNQN